MASPQAYTFEDVKCVRNWSWQSAQNGGLALAVTCYLWVDDYHQFCHLFLFISYVPLWLPANFNIIHEADWNFGWGILLWKFEDRRTLQVQKKKNRKIAKCKYRVCVQVQRKKVLCAYHSQTQQSVNLQVLQALRTTWMFSNQCSSVRISTFFINRSLCYDWEKYNYYYY